MMFDAMVIGGSFAGLSAAMQLGRARRDVLVIDAGLNRNRFAHAANGLLGHDGKSPAVILATARAELLKSPTVQRREATVVSAGKDEMGFVVGTNTGETYRAHRLVLGIGITDRLPQIPGLAEHWGRSVFHCPYCHGFELADRRLGSIVPTVEAVQHMQMLRDWSDDVTIFTNGLEVDPASVSGVRIETRPIAKVVGNDVGVEQVELVDGTLIPIDAIHVVSSGDPVGDIAQQLGCELVESPMGLRIKVSERFETSVPGVCAAGDAARGAGNLALAIADGSMAGSMTHQSLLFDPGIPKKVRTSVTKRSGASVAAK
ncbi:MAG: NAD(P)/FAD-dependent oxidoreductase [Thermomicrobiales bacterium]